MRDFEAAWDELDHRFQECLGQAWETLIDKGLPVGALVADGGEIVARGRNRAYDPRGGVDALQRTPIAHAEMNALAALPEGIDLKECQVWSTQRPCSMCQAAMEFIGMGTTHVLASDPSMDSMTSPWSGEAGPIWVLVANTLFLHNVAWMRGAESQTVARNSLLEPETTRLVRELVEQHVIIELAEERAALPQGLVAIWPRITVAAETRRERLAGQP